MKRGQSTLDYILLIGVVAAGLVAMLVYVNRGFQGNVRDKADQLSSWQYDPNNITIDNTETKIAHSYEKGGSSTVIDYGDNMYRKEALRKIALLKEELKNKKNLLETSEKSLPSQLTSQAERWAKSAREGEALDDDRVQTLKNYISSLQSEMASLNAQLASLQASLPPLAEVKVLESGGSSSSSGGSDNTKITKEELGNLIK
jgi:predicted RNase H-like nuclease (RuvC/YqgF family)